MSLDQSARARVVGINFENVNIQGEPAFDLPQQVGVLGQGNSGTVYSSDPVTTFRSQVVGETFGFGSPLHRAALELYPPNNDGVGLVPTTFFPLQEGAGAVAAAGDITPTGTHAGSASYTVTIGGISASFVLQDGDDAAAAQAALVLAISSSANMPVTAASGTGAAVDVTAKWAASDTNDIDISIDGPADQGVTFAITAMAGGSGNPDDVTAALMRSESQWITMWVACVGAVAAVFDEISTWNEGRWDAIVKRPSVFFTGYTDTLTAALAIAAARRTDRSNLLEHAPGSKSLPLTIAARAVARAARQANANPPVDYCGKRLTGIDPGGVDDRLTYAERNQAVVGGVSTVEYVDGELEMSNTVTFWRPSGEEPPAYQHVVDIVKLQQIIYNLNLIFESDEWKGAPLIPDEQPTTNRAARKPKNAVADVNAMIDGLGNKSVIADAAASKARTRAWIDSQNPKRLNVEMTISISGNVHVMDVNVFWSFYTGQAPVIN